MDKQLWQRPVFFDRNRVYRVYLGGKLFHDFLGDAPEDGFYPEEWVASTVHAMNAVSKGPFEGISMIEGTIFRLRSSWKSTGKTASAGAVRCGDFAHALKKGDYFFLPACAAGEAIVEGELELLICRGGIEP